MNVAEVCQTLGVSRSGYRAHTRKHLHQRRVEDAAIAIEVSESFHARRQAYGALRRSAASYRAAAQ